MTTEQRDVLEWMVAFGQEVLPKPTIPSIEVRKLRAKLILEEALETIKGLGLIPFAKHTIYEDDSLEEDLVGFYEEPNRDSYQPLRPNLEEIADGIADSIFVLLGTACACGIDMESIWNEVVRSNNSKFWIGDDLKEENISEPLNFTPIDNDQYLAKNLHGKVIKSPSYSPPNIKVLLEQQQTNEHTNR